ncbi:MAG: DUF434 domain-containing protein [Pyrinomonadaceae bacterium]
MSPDKRQHRGAHPSDARLFDERHVAALRVAVSELSWLLSRAYTMRAALKLVGDRHALRERQRLAVSRAACSDESLEKRKANCLSVQNLKGEEIIVDGFNLIITIEAAMSEGVLILCRDGCIRDLASVHGSYRSVTETERAIRLIGEAFKELEIKSATWLLDSPVSNSGRLARKVREMSAEQGFDWNVETVFSPDAEIISSDKIAVTSDSLILDRAGRWVNLHAYLIENYLPQSWLVDLRDADGN